MKPESAVHWDATQYDSKHGYVPRYGADVVRLLDPHAGERILDLGCGTGRLTRQIADSGAHVVGLDASPEMIEQARSQYPSITFVVADASDFAFDEPFDAIFSNAVLHWIPRERQPGVADCMAHALKPGGRIAIELGGKGNVRMMVQAIVEGLLELGSNIDRSFNPWYNPTVGEYASLLEQHGIEVPFAELFDRPTALDSGDAGIGDWIDMFGGAFLVHLPPGRHDDLVAAVERRLRDTMYRDGVWYADYRRLRIAGAKRPL